MVRVRVVYARAETRVRGGGGGGGGAVGSTRNLRAGPCTSNALRTNIVTLAQIRPPHCTISCLASRSAITVWLLMNVLQRF